MRQITLALWVLFLSFCIVGGAMAAPPTKPPAGICFSLDLPFSSSLQMTLAIKPMGAVTMADGSTRFYAINGVLFNPDNTSPWVAPVLGTGYVQKVPGESGSIIPFFSLLRFSVAGSTYLRRQLRVPLIQRALAAKLQRPELEISVGFQNIDGTQLELISFPRVVLDEAEDRARRLTSILSNEWRR